MKRKSKPGLTGIAPLQDRLTIAENINSLWLWSLAAVGATLVLLAILLDLVWRVDNILPAVSLELGAGAILFSLLFYLERRIVRRTSLVFVSALEELATRIGQDPAKIKAHFEGPVATVNNFVRAILESEDYWAAWNLADADWRLCRAQAWLWNNRKHPEIAAYDKNEAATSLAERGKEHPLWISFAQTELDQFKGAWTTALLSFGASSATRRVDDKYQIVLLVDLSEHPEGAIVHAPTPVTSVPVLVRDLNGGWLIANLVGDRPPTAGWPPNWNEGWTYWDQFRHS